MNDAVVFGGNNSLDFQEVRLSVVRIPEVSLRIEEAQSIWDKKCGSSFSFQHFLCSENTFFFNNINLKSLSLAIVQLGLYDRYVRLFKEPKYLVGNIQNDSALLVASGLKDFSALIAESPACNLQRPMMPLHEASELVLKGRALPTYQAYELIEVANQVVALEEDPSSLVISAKKVVEPDMNIQRVLEALIDEFKVTKIVNVGPGASERSQIVHDLAMREVQIVESIDIDPMLGWFWAGLRKQEKADLLCC